MPIEFYDPMEENGYLANFSDTPFFLRGRRWATVEHYYQSQKFRHDLELMQRIANAATPLAAKHLAKTFREKIDPKWGQIREGVMYDAISAKFRQNHDLAEKLVSTGDEMIVEAAADDDYWGNGRDGLGLNRMGVLLMRLRQEMASNRSGFSL